MLTEPHLEILRIVVNRLIPADDYPSGWDAGVGDYFAQLFVREPLFLHQYERGLPALEAESLAVSNRSLLALNDSELDALLAKIERGDVATEWPIKPREFFSLFVEQTMEGYYADPGNGGNKGAVAWDMVNYRMTA